MAKGSRDTKFKKGMSATVVTVLFMGILIFVALIAQRHPARLDLTETGEFSLADQSINILKSLDKDVEALAFFQEGQDNKARVDDLLETYSYHSKRFGYTFIDPVRKPDLAKRYQIRFAGTIVLKSGERWQTVSDPDEEGITNGLMKLMSEKDKSVYFLAGHGEKSLEDSGKDGYSGLKRALKGENYQVEELNLLEKPEVPEDAALIVLAGPKKPLLKSEVDAIRKYMEKGGSLLAMLEPGSDGGLTGILYDYGLKAENDIVIDKMSQALGGSYLIPVISSYGEHKITEGFNTACFFPTARTVDTHTPPEGVDVTRLAFTSKGSWGEKDVDTLNNSGSATYDEETDRIGPLCLGIAAEKGVSRVVLLGDSDFPSNSYFNLLANGDFILNAVNYLAEEETKIAIDRPQKEGGPLVLNPAQAKLVFWIPLVLIPLVPLVLGVAVYVRRRRAG